MHAHEALVAEFVARAELLREASTIPGYQHLRSPCPPHRLLLLAEPVIEAHAPGEIAAFRGHARACVKVIASQLDRFADVAGLLDKARTGLDAQAAAPDPAESAPPGTETAASWEILLALGAGMIGSLGIITALYGRLGVPSDGGPPAP